MANVDLGNGCRASSSHGPRNGLLQHFVRAGSGDPVVLLHGFAQTWLGMAPGHHAGVFARM